MAGGDAYDELGPLYDVWCREVTEDIPFWVGLVGALAHELGRASLDIVELGAGSGRIAIEMALAGHRVTAIDLSPVQLERLRARAGAAGVERLIDVRAGDMRDVATIVETSSCDAVLVPFRGMLHVTEHREQVLRDAAAVVRPGGLVAFDVFHPDATQVAATHDRWLKRRVEATTSGRWRFDERGRYAEAPDGDLLLDVDVRARWEASRRGTRGAVLTDPPEGAPTERNALLQLRLTTADAWRDALQSAGLELDGAYGWFDGRPLAPHDDDSIWIARRPLSN
ncbi:MAG: Methyltransferase type 12 [Thermoleophilia bacterium]|nr:Methyltransferase type 12 [Thermoleophilia bacterium]